jgi:hypothetical protein
VSRRFWFKNRDPAHWRDVWQVDAVVGKYIISDKSMTAEDWIRERSSTSSRETFTEIESGRNSERPALAKALAAARVRHVPIVVAKVDQLTRSVGFLSMLLDAGVDVRFADLPQIKGTTGRFMLKQMALVAELDPTIALPHSSELRFCFAAPLEDDLPPFGEQRRPNLWGQSFDDFPPAERPGDHPPGRAGRAGTALTRYLGRCARRGPAVNERHRPGNAHTQEKRLSFNNLIDF